ncbi:TolC family protein [Thermopirellula anaerolimosa]
MTDRSARPRIVWRMAKGLLATAALGLPYAMTGPATMPRAAAETGARNFSDPPGAAVIFVEEAPAAEPAPTPADSSPELTLEELEQLALRHHPALVRAEALVGAAQGRQIQAGLPNNPSIGYDGQQIGSGGRAEQHGIFVEQEFRLGGKRQLDEAVAARETALARGDWETRRRQVLTEVHIAFHEAAVAMRNVELADSLVKISSEIERTLAALYQAQEVTRAAWLESRLEAESARLMEKKAEERYAAARRKLAATVGVAELPPQPLRPEPSDLSEPEDFEAVWRRIRVSSPELLRAGREVERARAVLRRACAEAVPNLTVQGLVNVIDNGAEGTTNGGISVSLPVPIFNRNQGAIMQARYELSAAESAVRELELELRGRLAEVYARYRQAWTEAERYRSSILPTAEEVLNLTRKSYQAGEASFADLLLAERSYVQKQAEYLEALLRFRTAEAEMAGDLVTLSLASP